MPKALLVDWALAQSLYIQGFAHKLIAEKIGCRIATMQRHAQRHGWTALRARTLAVVNEHATGTTIRDLTSIAKEIRETLADDSLRSAKALYNKDPSRMNLYDMEMRERTAQSLTRRAWQTLGLDQQGAGGVVNVNLLAQFSVDEAHSGHTLDVTGSEPALLKDTLNHSLPEAGGPGT